MQETKKGNARLDELLAYVKDNDRICPMPKSWDQLWNLLPNRKQHGAGWEPPAPLILGGWWASSNNSKQDRLEVHIRYAFDQGKLDEADRFLRSLPETEWKHSED